MKIMDPTANMNQLNSDTKECKEKLVSSSNIPIGDILDNKLGHYWSKYVTMEVKS